MKVQIFVPCFIDQLYPNVAFAMVKVLRQLGCEVVYNSNQTCCGQPAFNAGFHDDARDVCRKFINDFTPDIPVVAPSASCVGFVKNYYKEIFASGTPDATNAAALGLRTFEFADFLVNQLQQTRLGAVLHGKATYHDSCAALRECKLKAEPRALLAQVEGLELVEMNDVETCCGFGGTFAVKFEAISGAMADQKLGHAMATGAKYIISTDMSCLMHLDGAAKKKGLPLQCLHLAEVLAGEA